MPTIHSAERWLLRRPGSPMPHNPALGRRGVARFAGRAGLAGVAALALAGCSVIGTGSDSGTGTGSEDSDGEGGGVVQVVTHDSFHVSEELIADFEAESGYTVELSAPGDGGALVNQLILTADSPLGDVAYGVDNSFASRALEEGVFESYTSPALPASAEEYLVEGSDALTPIDIGDVCLNVDHEWFAEAGIDEPETFEDLLEEQYEDLLVVTNPATSSPGLAFLLATVGAFGEDGWLEYWEGLADNGLKVVDGWSDAYSVDFSGSAGEGDRPIVLSYSTSPAFEVAEGETEAPTGALLSTCFRQIEYAGVIAGAANPEGGQAFIDFLLSDEVQADIPEQMYVYPVNDQVELPESWTQFAPLAEDPHSVDPAEIDAHRDEWIQEWTATVIG
ncbi:thiamine ABC transporter substrate-binding protein [Ruania halotolerans]|uniref:thiamine ABC transporter substrate-binding protein n=1 Tax=Ruania halotolerans TaxID=2897773 RepID=UPI001E5D580A|nr:thiamine ABC transporter substrate-binding protein [Ruania halotolerans]UFU06174.1 thiamine ABC transporter substrate-binding protein [Ruania halotolerans]